jgi:uncharacterized protein YbbC (DUF1343 family)
VAVRIGLEVLLDERRSLICGRRVGLLAHPASVDSRLNHAVDRLLAEADVNLVALFGPQHGTRGETQANMIEWEGYRDSTTGLPVHSLYGKTRKPTAEMLQDIDVLVVDLQDVGARYYTFIYTMALAMEACAEQGTEVIVLDRPNPINGLDLEGPLLDPAFASFVGRYPLPVRHGLTIGELALLFSGEFGLSCPLQVVPMRGWQREMFFDQTGLTWVPPSPNMPRLETALVYPGLCLLEGTNVSEGRGTTLPFELSGAPWVDPGELARELSRVGLPGVRFRPAWFQPTFDKWAGHRIGGIQLHLNDRRRFRPFRCGLELVRAYREFGAQSFVWKPPPYEYEFQLLPFDILCGSDRIRGALESGEDLETLERSWDSELGSYRSMRNRYLLY